MESRAFHSWRAAVVLACIAWAIPFLGQQTLNSPEIPPHFTLDFETAARLGPQLRAQSVAAAARYSIGNVVFERLITQVPPAANASTATHFAWELRIVEDDELNAYASPDGTIYVESGLARLAGPSSGLWAAILSHEIAHVVRRDWARRYLYQKSLESSGVSIVLGDPGLPSASWSDSQASSADLGRFCRELELEADREGLMLMARAGYHPDFVPALHHLLHAQTSADTPASLYAMHPCWEERDRELDRAYLAAREEFERLWPAWYASPGGNPPIVVFTESPTIRKTAAQQWTIEVPMRCQNLAGAVEVILRSNIRAAAPNEPPAKDDEERQVTGCTSPTTTVTFTFVGRPASDWTDIFVVDAWGSVLARADVPRLRR